MSARLAKVLTELHDNTATEDSPYKGPSNGARLTNRLSLQRPLRQMKDLPIEAVRRYQRASREKGGSKFSQHAYLRSVKTFLRWLGRGGYVERELWRGVEMPKVPSYNDVTIDVLNDDEIERLLSFLDPVTDVGCRDRGIFCLMLESGLRHPCARDGLALISASSSAPARDSRLRSPSQ